MSINNARNTIHCSYLINHRKHATNLLHPIQGEHASRHALMKLLPCPLVYNSVLYHLNSQAPAHSDVDRGEILDGDGHGALVLPAASLLCSPSVHGSPFTRSSSPASLSEVRRPLSAEQSGQVARAAPDRLVPFRAVPCRPCRGP